MVFICPILVHEADDDYDSASSNEDGFIPDAAKAVTPLARRNIDCRGACHCPSCCVVAIAGEQRPGTKTHSDDADGALWIGNDVIESNDDVRAKRTEPTGKSAVIPASEHWMSE
jgi:hypothetical protein